MMMELDQMMMISILDLQMVVDMLNLLLDQLLTLNQHPILMLIQLLNHFQKKQQKKLLMVKVSRKMMVKLMVKTMVKVKEKEKLMIMKK